MKLTPAGLQIERALAQGFDVAAFNLYADAIGNGVELVRPEDAGDSEQEECLRWHRDIQSGIDWSNAPVQDGSILVDRSYERNDDGEVISSEPTTLYRSNPEGDE